MNKEKFYQYIKDFNRGDFEKVASTYYTEDIIFDTPDYRIEGKEEVKRFFTEHHKGMDETMMIENVLVDGSAVAAELCADMYFTVDRPDFRLKPMKKGQSLKMRFFVFYDTKDGKISQIKLCRKFVELKAAQP